MADVAPPHLDGRGKNWTAYTAAQVNEKWHFRLLLHELCKCVEQPMQDCGRPRLSLADMLFCIVFRVYSIFCSRRFMTDLREAQEKGFIARTPHFNSLSHYLRMPLLTPVLMRLIELSSLPLEVFEVDFAVDSTGLGLNSYKRWLDERELKERARREWIKVHLICGVRTKIVASVIVSSADEHDSKFFGRLVAGAARNFRLAEVSADKAYSSGENMRHIVLTGATPFIAFKTNTRLDADYKSTIWKRMLAMSLHERARFMAHYNKRNNVETVFSMIKSKFGPALRSKDKRGQINEALAKVLCHNLCVLVRAMYELDIKPQFDQVIDPAASMEQEGKSLAPIAEHRIVAAAQNVLPFVDASQRKKTHRKRRRAHPDQMSLLGEE